MARGRLAGVVCVAACLAFPLPAKAGVGGVLKPAAVPCYFTTATHGCSQADHVEPASPSFFLEELAFSPNGASLYAVHNDGIVSFSRDAATGALTEIDFDAAAGLHHVAVAPDGRDVYAVSASALYAFRRDTATGALTPNGTTSLASGAAVAAGASYVYVTEGGGRVQVFNRNTLNGTVSAGACASPDGSSGACLAVSPLGPSMLSVGLDPTGTFIYVTSEAEETITVLKQNGDGSLSAPLASQGGCASPTGSHGCVAVSYAAKPRALAVSASTVAVVSALSDSVYVLSRRQDGTLAGRTHACITPAPTIDCPGTLTATNFGYAVGLDPGGGNVYFTARNAAYVGVEDILGDGSLHEKAAPLGCLEQSSDHSCENGFAALNAPSYARTSPDGKFVYVSAGGGLSVFRRYGPPTCKPLSRTTTVGKSVGFALSCAGYPGDALTITATTQPAHGKLTLTPNGAATYTPAAGFSGFDSFTFHATATGERSDAATVSMRVTIPKLRSVVRSKWALKHHGNLTIVRELDATKVPKGGSVKLRCKARQNSGCPFSSRTFKAKRAGTVKLGPALKSAQLPVRTVITVRITAPHTIGRLFTYTTRKGKKPSLVTACVNSAGQRVKCR